MTAKRFTYDYEDDKYYDRGFFKDNGKELFKDELLELLNTLHEENEELKLLIKKVLETTPIEHSLAIDLKNSIKELYK